jgi:uncharacterized protein YbcI
MTDDLVVCVLENTFTPAERTLIDHGERESIQSIRRRFRRRSATSSSPWSSR